MDVVSSGEDVVRPIANFSPSVWGDFFMNYSHPLANNQKAITLMEQRAEELKRTVKAMFSTDQYLTERLRLIDDLQRLGIDYLFKQDIDDALECIHIDNDNINDDNMYLVALRFRLLRQQEHHVSSDVFSKFKDDNGRFKQESAGDIMGLLQLYEATGLRIKEDSILDEAFDFARYHMERTITADTAKGVLADRIRHAMEMPFHRSRKRLGARYYMSIYEKDEAHNDVLLELAKLDFTLLQRLHQDELKIFNMWYNKELGPDNISFSRDRAAENYFWAKGTHFEPEYATGRMLLAKMVANVVTWDDMYDAYGTFDELQLFTDVIERWDLEDVNHLPEYMRVYISSLSKFMREVEEELIKKEILHLKPYVVKMMKYMIDGYFVEAKWLNEGYTPTLEEYLANGHKTGGQLTLNAFALLFVSEDKVTEDTLDWVFTNPNILKASNLIGRLLNDITSTKMEQERKHVPSSIQIYMNETGVTESMAIAKLSEMVADFWKDINKELLNSLPFQKSFNTLALNFARVVEVLYKHGDSYNHASMQREHVDLMLVRPIQN